MPVATPPRKGCEGKGASFAASGRPSRLPCSDRTGLSPSSCRDSQTATAVQPLLPSRRSTLPRCKITVAEPDEIGVEADGPADYEEGAGDEQHRLAEPQQQLLQSLNWTN